MTAGKTFSPEEIQGLIDSSGFPFEVQVARVLQDLGFSPQPSYRIYDPRRERDVEIDIAATFDREQTTTTGVQVRSSIWLGIECKSSFLPYVLFGLPHVGQKDPTAMDPDFTYVHINTSRDLDHPNRYAAGVFLRDTSEPALKTLHHHFTGADRYRVATQVDCVSGGGKPADRFKGPFNLHVSDPLSDATRKLGLFVSDYHQVWQSAMKNAGSIESFERMVGGTVCFSSCFLLLVHDVAHYRYMGDGGGPIESFHTPVFASHSTADASEHFVVDFVSRLGLRAAIDTIKQSHDAMLRKAIGGLVRDQGISAARRNGLG